MSKSQTAMRVSGWWLAVGGLLLTAALVFHGPPSPDMAVQMETIAEGALRWSTVHWVAAMALSSFAIGGLIVLTAGSRLTADPWALAAWAVLTVGALWTMTTAVAEATTVTHAAGLRQTGVFEAWWVFSAGKANGFVALALAVAAIAINETGTAAGMKPNWAPWIGVVAAVLSVAGWVLGSWLGFGFGGPVWVVASTVMSLWLVWFGLSLTRTQEPSSVKQSSAARPVQSGG